MAARGQVQAACAPRLRGLPVPKAVFVLNDLSEREVEVVRHESLMRAAVRNNVEGIAADCGGSLTCATCHVYVDDAWLDKLSEPSEDEEDLLYTAQDRRGNSRLSCQILLSEELDGLKVTLAEGARKD